MRIFTICFCASMLIYSGCGAVDATAGAAGSLFKKKPKVKSQLEMRQMQTREFETSETTMVLQAMLNVLQDEGYIVQQVNSDIGFFNATKVMDTEDTFAKTWGTFWWGPSGQWIENTVIDCTANVSQFGEKTRVRTNFQLKQMNNKGGVDKVQTMDDPKFYQDFFTKVDKGIFLEKEQI
jgi:ribosomal protein S8